MSAREHSGCEREFWPNDLRSRDFTASRRLVCTLLNLPVVVLPGAVAVPSRQSISHSENQPEEREFESAGPTNRFWANINLIPPINHEEDEQDQQVVEEQHEEDEKEQQVVEEQHEEDEQEQQVVEKQHDKDEKEQQVVEDKHEEDEQEQQVVYEQHEEVEQEQQVVEKQHEEDEQEQQVVYEQHEEDE
ncbi:hypothetical protein PoB_004297600 [Plakobranchus ocellatus]|uniref:Uncharacterized protein n=1 Tax=Plakobranchus ocellatus TaxID=259542 RepID=A0AAV4BCB4_9GAST|nr:hypothetical protein PoB_004297600 [Plakobranchus ocellatus]